MLAIEHPDDLARLGEEVCLNLRPYLPLSPLRFRRADDLRTNTFILETHGRQGYYFARTPGVYEE